MVKVREKVSASAGGLEPHHPRGTAPEKTRRTWQGRHILLLAAHSLFHLVQSLIT